MKIKEEELKLIQEQQKKLNELISNIGVLETQKHWLLHEIAGVNKEVEDYKEILEKENYYYVGCLDYEGKPHGEGE